MPNQKKQDQLQQLKSALQNSKAVILTNYAGLSVNHQNQLRRDIQTAGGSFNVVKNTLLSLALKDRLGTEDLPDQLDWALQGPTALLLTPTDDPISPTKILAKFITDHEIPKIKLGLLDDRLLSLTEVESLAKLPDRQQLLAQLVGQLNAPIFSFAQVLRANLQNLVFAFEAIRVKGGESHG